MDRSYTLHQSYKTKFLNFFRRIFTIRVLEKFIQNRTLQNPDGFFKKLIPPDYLYKNGAFRLFQRGGINYRLDISNVVDHYLYFGIEDSDFSSIHSYTQQASVILDIGANIATTSLCFASINQHARILSFEPHPDTFVRARENVRLNPFKNIELFNVGLGEKMEKVKLYEVNKNNPGMNRIFMEEKDYPYKLITIEKLDDFLEAEKIHRVDLIKIDVEGFELSVLKGGEKIIRSCKPILFIELDDDNLRDNGTNAGSMIELLISFGYKNIYRASDRYPLTPFSDFLHVHYDIIAE